MKRFKTLIGLMMMLCALVVSEEVNVLIVYIVAAIVHELGHIIAAKILKIKIKEISFDFSGLRIEVDEKLTPYGTELVLAAAGPFANFIASFAVCIVMKKEGVDIISAFEAAEKFIDTGEANFAGICVFFVMSSCVQAVINLLPVKTFDGGRILYCTLAGVSDERIADSVLSVTSCVFAFMLWTVSLYLMLKMSAGLGIYIFSACIFAITLKDSSFRDFNSSIEKY
ncbi:MAG: hypothetical protein IKA62_07400 [Clostridia bacterium]|nr:hypothetical protein [Clostridia bacterium]